MNYREKIDYSSLSTYLECPRKFLFQYLLHLRNPRPSIHLVFGSCWHYGLEVVYQTEMEDPNIDVKTATKLAIDAFNLLWSIEGAPHWPDEDIIFPKSPGHAANVYHAYFKRFLKADQKESTVLAVESPFAIHISDELPNYIGRFDLLRTITRNNALKIGDHKTTNALYKTAGSDFEMSFQSIGYLTAARIYYDSIPTIEYTSAIFRKSNTDFVRYQINKRVQAVNQFLHELKFYMKDITKQLDTFQQDKLRCLDRNDLLNCFHRRPGHPCTAFFKDCSFFDLCKLRNNPLLWLEKPPQGYVIHEWDPDSHNEDLKMKIAEASG
ncbi:MAG: PD-(D/E)XK nuclease family protein [Planctomycetes bacterium]|nr:PD-(D/E)XK nuclease family protein [Planctomycetota bacterium]